MNSTFIALIIADLAVALVIGAFFARAAVRKQRDEVFWFLAGFGAGFPLFVIPAAVLYLIPRRSDVRHPERRRWYEHAAARHPLRFLASCLYLGGVYLLAERVAESTTDAVLPIAGLFFAGWAFVAAAAVARALLAIDAAPFAVARVVLSEALSSRLAIGFIVVMLIVLAMLTAFFEQHDTEPLRYRIQGFLSWSFIIVGLFQGALTILFACWTLGSEIRDRQVFTVAVKPIPRPLFLVGKWLGLVALNAVLLVVVGAAIYSFSVFYLARLPGIDSYDNAAVRSEVLTARHATLPDPERELGEMVDQRIRQMLESEPQRLEALGREVADTEGLVGLGPEALVNLGIERARTVLAMEIAQQQMSIEPGQERTYVYTGLSGVKRRWQRKFDDWRARADAAQAAGRRPPPPPATDTIQLRYELKVSAHLAEGVARLRMTANGNPISDRGEETIALRVNNAQVVHIPAAFIDDNGELRITIGSSHEHKFRVYFDPDDGLTILHRADDFTSNFLRALAALWVKLAFLAMLGLTAASFLGFPVACVLSMVVAVGAVGSPFLLESVGSYDVSGGGALGIVQRLIRVMAQAIAETLNRFAEYSPGSQLARGRLFSWAELGSCAFWIGGIWTLSVGLLGAVFFHRRELAHVQV